MRLLLAGASGLIGTELKRRLAGSEHEVRTLVRRAAMVPDEYTWDPRRGTVPGEAIEWADAVISLSGASLAKLPWTRRYQAEILSSRTQATATIARAIGEAADPPRAWVSGSAVGFYGDDPGAELTESSAQGEGFLPGVVHAWEEATRRAEARTRVVHARTGIVLAREGALKPLFLMTRLGLGATVGSGRQYWPWIGLGDEARALVHLATDSQLSGAVNLVGPTPATAKEITVALARAVRRPHLLWLPEWALRLGLGLAAEELLLSDQRVIPQLLTAEGFAFEHRTAAEVLADVVA